MFILRKLIEQEKAARMAAAPPADSNADVSANDFYICTLSNKTIVYKVCNIQLYD